MKFIIWDIGQDFVVRQRDLFVQGTRWVSDFDFSASVWAQETSNQPEAPDAALVHPRTS